MSRVIDKVKGLLAIANDDSASDGEIEACLTQVRKLMDKHQLSEDDLATEPEDQCAQLDAADCGEFAVYVGRKIYAWESRLTMVVAGICGVKVYRDSCGPQRCRSPHGVIMLDDNGNPKTGKRFWFYGIAEDCIIACGMFYDLRELIATMAFARFGTIYKGEGGVYAQGFVTGINSQFASEREAERQKAIEHNDTTALVLAERRTGIIEYKEDIAEKWLEANKDWKLTKRAAATGASGSRSAYNQGREDGSNTDVSFSRRKKLA